MENGVYSNGTFSIFPYWWGDCSCGAEEKEEDCKDYCKLVIPNFIHHPSGFTLSWYKYALRDSYSNMPFTNAMLQTFIQDANNEG